MYKVNYKIETLTPVLVSDYSGDKNTRKVMDYIPGNVLLGVTARLIDKGVIVPNSFTIQDLIFGQKILFGDAVITENSIQALPAPMGFYHVKGEPAFPRWEALQELPQTILKPVLHKNAKFDKNDDRIWKPIRSGWLLNMNGGLAGISVKSITNIHNIIDPDSQRPNEDTGGVFVYQALQSGLIFSGDIRFQNKELADDFVKIMGKERRVRIGKSLGAEYGEAKLILDEPEKIKTLSVPTDFTRILLISDTIVKDNLGIYQTSLTPEILTHYLRKFGYDKVTVEQNTDYINYFRTRIVQGFNAKWGQYRSNVPAIVRGSVFHFNLRGEQVSEALQALYENGLGERRNEGFGRIAFMHPLFEEDKIKTGEAITVQAPRISFTQAESSIKKWWEITGMPDSVKKAVFKSEIQKQITRFLFNEFFDGDRLKNTLKRSKITNAQLQGLRNIALRATSVKNIVDFVRKKENKKAHKKGQWNLKIKGISLFDFFTKEISNVNEFYSFIELGDIDKEYRSQEYHLLALQMFIHQFVSILIKTRSKQEEVEA